jgi:hypothetical protein
VAGAAVVLVPELPPHPAAAQTPAAIKMAADLIARSYFA